MPEITRFYGIVISLLYKEHNPPHFHAEYGEYKASFDIESLKMKGNFPPTASRLVKAWAKQHRAELLKMWKEQKIKKLPPLA